MLQFVFENSRLLAFPNLSFSTDKNVGIEHEQEIGISLAHSALLITQKVRGVRAREPCYGSFPPLLRNCNERRRLDGTGIHKIQELSFSTEATTGLLTRRR